VTTALRPHSLPRAPSDASRIRFPAHGVRADEAGATAHPCASWPHAAGSNQPQCRPRRFNTTMVNTTMVNTTMVNTTMVKTTMADRGPEPRPCRRIPGREPAARR
jgi:hypothetical protein